MLLHNKIIDIVKLCKAQVVFMMRPVDPLFWSLLLPSLFAQMPATDIDTLHIPVTSERLTVQGTTCTIALNSEVGGTEINQSLPVGRQRNFKSFSLITTAVILGLLLLVNIHISKPRLFHDIEQNR